MSSYHKCNKEVGRPGRVFFVYGDEVLFKFCPSCNKKLDWSKGMIYEYKCKLCNHVQESWHKMNETNKEPCEKCEAPAENLKKIMSVGGGPHISWSKWRV